MKSILKTLFVGLLVVRAASADIKPSLLTELRDAKVRLDKKGPDKTPAHGEPSGDRYQEFAALVDESYNELESDAGTLLALKPDDPTLPDRMTAWVQTAALSVYLDPGHSAGDLIDRLLQKRPTAFAKAVANFDTNLDPNQKVGLRERLNQVIKLQSGIRKRGNGG